MTRPRLRMRLLRLCRAPPQCLQVHKHAAQAQRYTPLPPCDILLLLYVDSTFSLVLPFCKRVAVCLRAYIYSRVHIVGMCEETERCIDRLAFSLSAMTSVDASPYCSIGTVKNYGFEDKFLKLVGLLRQHYSLSHRTSGEKLHATDSH